MRVSSKISNEADYLQAHLTVLDNEPRTEEEIPRNVKERFTYAVRNWMTEANTRATSLLPESIVDSIKRMR